jgi:plastocyanin
MENWYKAVLIAVLALGAIIGVLAGRGQSTQSAPALPTAAPTIAPTPIPGQIEILGSQFRPSTITVHAGQKITWVNDDNRAHGPVAKNGEFSSNALSPHQSFSWTPRRAGTYRYADFVNSNLTGTIVVR